MKTECFLRKFWYERASRDGSFCENVFGARMSVVKSVVFVAVSAGALAYLRLFRRRDVLLGYDLARSYRSHGAFRNRLFIVRHGQSEANVEGIISSSPDVGTVKHSITSRGEQQARRAGNRIETLCKEIGIGREELKEKVKVFCSDFLRTRRTAAVVTEEMGLDSDIVQPVKELRERFFGHFDGQADENYHLVWRHDQYSVFHEENQCESVSSVVKRAANFVLKLDAMFEDKVIILVAHGDVLQILRTAFDGAFPPALHRSGESLQTGSVTRLSISPLQ